jgi:methanogenic corrinoid protein MtbC1
VQLQDVPESYRSNPKIISFLSQHSQTDISKKATMVESFRERLFSFLSEGDVESCTKLYRECKSVMSLEAFYDDLLRPVMYDIGNKWEDGVLDIVTEHVCSNTAHELIAAINQLELGPSCRERILVCSPEGEMHRLPVSVLESVLRSRGYHVINASPSLPADSLLHHIRNNDPRLVMISVTLRDNLGAAKRLARNIADKFAVPSLVGGAAFASYKGDFYGSRIVPPADNSLVDIIRLVQFTLRGAK